MSVEEYIEDIINDLLEGRISFYQAMDEIMDCLR